ncbi:MAG: sensor histidine kinase [Caldilineaceae bacterium]
MNTTKTVHAWERMGWVWSVIFFLSLGLPWAYWMVQRQATPQERWLASVLILIGGVAHWFFALEMPRRGVAPRGRLWYGLAYAGVITAVTFGLIVIHDIFFFVIGGYFSQLAYFLPITLSIPISVAAMPILAIQANEIGSLAEALRQPVFWIWLLGGVCGSLVALWISAIIQQTGQQHELIEELRRTQAELAASERSAGVLAERQRLAREIHDTLAQGFISVVTHLEAADQALESEPSTARRHIGQAAATARESLDQARRVVQDLRPEVLEGSSLAEAIQREADKWSARTGVVSTVTSTGTALPLPPEAEVTLLRAVQESLANVHKHAAASAVSITLSYMPDRVLLDVQDNGRGFQPKTHTQSGGGGFGLTAMRQRAEALAGAVYVESSPGEGTTVAVEIPRQN